MIEFKGSTNHKSSSQCYAILRLGKIVRVLGINTTHTNYMFVSWEDLFTNACNPHDSAMHQETQQHQPLKVQEALSKLVDVIHRV
jgi:hypothetical protein